MGLYRIFTLKIYELAISPLITLNTIYFHVSCINFVCVCVCKRDTRVVPVFFSINIKTNNELKKINKTLRRLLEPGSRYASTNVLAAVPPGTPRAVSTEDITR